MTTDTVPALPVYTITIASTGAAMVDGQTVTDPGTTQQAARVAALAEVRVRAAFHGRPVRALVKDLDGSGLPLIVGVDGTTTTLDHPHPDPFVVVLTDPDDATQLPLDAAEESAVSHLAAHHRDRLTRITAHHTTGDTAAALAAAEDLEQLLTAECGPAHPDTLGALTLRAWLALHHPAASQDAETLTLLLDTAERRLAADVGPYADTVRVIRNAHACWRGLHAQDAETALDVAARLLVLLDLMPNRAADVLARVEQGQLPQPA